MRELRCPKCNSTNIDDQDCFDTVSTIGGLKEYHCGRCVDCGTFFQWSEVYEFTGYDDIEEDE